MPCLYGGPEEGPCHLLQQRPCRLQLLSGQGNHQRMPHMQGNIFLYVYFRTKFSIWNSDYFSLLYFVSLFFSFILLFLIIHFSYDMYLFLPVLGDIKIKMQLKFKTNFTISDLFPCAKVKMDGPRCVSNVANSILDLIPHPCTYKVSEGLPIILRCSVF